MHGDTRRHSAPWKISVFVFVLFLLLGFVCVGHACPGRAVGVLDTHGHEAGVVAVRRGAAVLGSCDGGVFFSCEKSMPPTHESGDFALP